MKSTMHVINAHKVALSLKDADLRDIFEATSAMGRYIESFPQNKTDQYLSKNESASGLSTLIYAVDHSDSFTRALDRAFAKIGEWLLYDKEMPEVVKFWNDASTAQRLAACTRFNNAAAFRLGEEFRAPLSPSEITRIYTPELYFSPKKALSPEEQRDFYPELTPPRFPNKILLNTHPESGFQHPYRTLRNLGVANIYLLMETMTNDIAYRWNPEEYRRDKELWGAVKKYDGFVSSELLFDFHRQFFRRAWEPAVSSMTTTVREGIDSLKLEPPPKRSFVQRVAGALGLTI